MFRVRPKVHLFCHVVSLVNVNNPQVFALGFFCPRVFYHPELFLFKVDAAASAGEPTTSD